MMVMMMACDHHDHHLCRHYHDNHRRRHGHLSVIVLPPPPSLRRIGAACACMHGDSVKSLETAMCRRGFAGLTTNQVKAVLAHHGQLVPAPMTAYSVVRQAIQFFMKGISEVDLLQFLACRHFYRLSAEGFFDQDSLLSVIDESDAVESNKSDEAIEVSIAFKTTLDHVVHEYVKSTKKACPQRKIKNSN